MNPPAPNDNKIADQMAALKRVRETGGMPVGWDDGQMPPSTARALERAGLVVINHATRTVHPLKTGNGG